MQARIEDAITLLQGACGQVFPGAVLHVWQGNDPVLSLAVGSTALFQNGTLVEEQTVFDLASLTKPLVTTAILMMLVDEGLVCLNDPIGKHLKWLAGSPVADRTLSSLLSHASGLPAWRPYGEEAIARHGLGIAGTATIRASVKETLAGESLHPVGTVSAYSDLGFMLLGWLVETLRGQPLDEAFADAIARPLGLHRTFFVRIREGRPTKIPCPLQAIAATEVLPTRGGLIQGVVHDDNAFVLGGVAGHAGLFSTASEVAKILYAMLDAWRGREDGLWRPETVRRFWSSSGDGPAGSTWRLGFDTPSSVASSCGSHPPEGAIGHLGFTGTSFWLHPPTGTGIVLLTNRVHPSRANEAIKTFRPRIHDEIWDALGMHHSP